MRTTKDVSRTRPLPVVLGLLAVVAALAAAAVWFTTRPTDVVFVGDSITDQARPVLVSHFRIGDDRVAAIGGITIDEMVQPAAALAATMPRSAVINLGTNDVGANEPAAENGALLSQMANTFPSDTCVVLVTIN